MRTNLLREIQEIHLHQNIRYCYHGGENIWVMFPNVSDCSLRKTNWIRIYLTIWCKKSSQSPICPYQDDTAPYVSNFLSYPTEICFQKGIQSMQYNKQYNKCKPGTRPFSNIELFSKTKFTKKKHFCCQLQQELIVLQWTLRNTKVSLKTGF